MTNLDALTMILLDGLSIQWSLSLVTTEATLPDMAKHFALTTGVNAFKSLHQRPPLWCVQNVFSQIHWFIRVGLLDIYIPIVLKVTS